MDIELNNLDYFRKSGEDNKERQAASIPDQRYVLGEMHKHDNVKVKYRVEESRSAHSPGRPVFNSALELIRKGEVNCISVWHENRLARNPVDAGLIIYEMDQGRLLQVRTPSRIYTNSPSDKFILQIELAASKKDSDDKAIVVKRGLNKKCREGWRPGVAPQGYLNDRATEIGLRKIYTDSERLPYIQKIFEMFRSGTPVVEIHHMAKEEWGYRTREKKRSGGRPLSISMIYKILGNPFYTGRFEYPEGKGIWHEGSHEAIISDELFNEVQIILGHKGQYKLKSHEWSYTSLIECGYCHSAITAEEKWQCICTHCKLKFSLTKKNKEMCPRCMTKIDRMTNPKILHYIYYRCTRRKDSSCRQRGLRLDLLEKQIDEELSSIEIPQSFVDWAVKQVKITNEKEQVLREDSVQSIERARRDTRLRLDNLLKLKLSPLNSDGSVLSDEQFKAEKTKLESEMNLLNQQLGNIDERMFKAAEEVNEQFTFAAQARK